jgi:hypothetical protein
MLRELGYDAATIQALEKDGVVRGTSGTPSA